MITSAVIPAHSRPYFLIEILQDLLAALVLEVNVDVGGFVPLAADEPLQQQVHPLRIDGGYAQAEADGRLAAEPRPWQRMPRLRAKTTRSQTVRK